MSAYPVPWPLRINIEFEIYVEQHVALDILAHPKFTQREREGTMGCLLH